MPRGRVSRTEEQTKRVMLSRRRITTQGCWLWMGCTESNGYGTIYFDHKQWQVHRLSLKFFKPDEYNDSLMSLHKNECSSKLCFNPDHLYAGTVLDNTRDAIEAGIHPSVKKDSCKNGHEYTSDNTYTVPTGGRQCKICRKANSNFQNGLRSLRKFATR